MWTTEEHGKLPIDSNQNSESNQHPRSFEEALLPTVILQSKILFFSENSVFKSFL